MLVLVLIIASFASFRPSRCDGWIGARKVPLVDFPRTSYTDSWDPFFGRVKFFWSQGTIAEIEKVTFLDLLDEKIDRKMMTKSRTDPTRCLEMIWDPFFGHRGAKSRVGREHCSHVHEHLFTFTVRQCCSELNTVRTRRASTSSQIPKGVGALGTAPFLGL